MRAANAILTLLLGGGGPTVAVASSRPAAPTVPNYYDRLYSSAPADADDTEAVFDNDPTAEQARSTTAQRQILHRRAAASCELPPDYKPYFLDAIDALELRVKNEVSRQLAARGLPPLLDTLPLSDLFDFKADLFDVVFGAPDSRDGWIDLGADNIIDIAERLRANFNDVIGSAARLISITCSLDENKDGAGNFSKRLWKMDLMLKGSLPSLSGRLDPNIAQQISILPSSFPNLDITTFPTLEVNYELHVPLSVNVLLKKFVLGETAAKFHARIAAEVSEDLPLLQSENVEFNGAFLMEGFFSFQYPEGWAATGGYEARLEAKTASSAIANSISIIATEDNMFDTKPPSVSFNFDLCPYRNRLVNSIQGFELSGVLDPVLDKYLTFSQGSNAGVVLFPPSFTNNVKGTIVNSAETKAIEIKNKIINEINSLPCSNRRLEMMEINEDGSQRILQDIPTFEDLAKNVLNFAGVKSAFAGYFPSRAEIALDVVINVNETVVDISDFRAALTTAFVVLRPAQTMFGAGGESANLAELLGNAQINVEFELALSTGFKVQDLMGFFTESTSDTNIGSLFLRFDAVRVEAKAMASNLNMDLFSGIGIEDGSFSLSAGVGIDAPFESELSATGDLKNGIGLSSTIVGQLTFIPFGQLAASLPFTITISKTTQTFRILMEDRNLFDSNAALVKVDFDACQVSKVVESLIGLLGSINLSPESILGPMSFGGINFFDNATNTLDGLFPDAGQFIQRALQANSEFFHMCAEVEETGSSEDPPTFEDVISMILEDILGTSNADPSTVGSTNGVARRRRALRAHHLSHNKYVRPQSSQRYLQEEEDDILGDLLDLLSVSGGFDGSMLFIRFELDVSAQSVGSLEDILKAPFQLLNDPLKNDFLSLLVPGNDESSPITLDLSFDLSASAHIGVLVGFEITGSNFYDLLFGGQAAPTSTQIAERSFLQLEDISAKFESSSSVSGSLDLAGAATFGIDDGSISMAFGLGMDEASPRLYFRNITSSLLALRQNASWRKIGVIDASLPASFSINVPNIPALKPIISITDGDLFGTSAPTMSIDFDILQLIDGADDLLANIMQELTSGLSNVANNDGANFNGGPLGAIEGVLDKFGGLNFATDLLDEFRDYYNSFKADILSLDSELQDLIRFKPKCLTRYTELLQLGSKKPSNQYSSELKGLLWDKLIATFPTPIHNGVQIPGLSLGLSFQDSFPIRGNFPVEKFLPLIAVAFQQATSFSDQTALSFNMKSLFQPNFGPNLSTKILSTLKNKAELNGIFNRFSGVDKSGHPWDPLTKEVFDIQRYLAEIQYAFDLSTSATLIAKSFHPSDLYSALFPKNLPSVRSFADFVKTKIVKEVNAALNGVFKVGSNIPTGGLNINKTIFGGGGISFGDFSPESTQLFPPRLNIDNIQGFLFDFEIDVSKSGTLSLGAHFTMNVMGVNPLATLSKLSSNLGSVLSGTSGKFEALTATFGSGFSQTAQMLNDVADQITLELDAIIDFKVNIDLSLNSFSVTSSLDEMGMKAKALIADDFSLRFGSFPPINISPNVKVSLEAKNTATPFDVLNGGISQLASFNFSGTFDSLLLVTVDDVPAQVFVSASSDDVTQLSSFDFELGIDIVFDEFLTNETIRILNEIGSLSYPRWLTEGAPFLPSFRLFLTCVQRNGIAYLARNETTITGFLRAIESGCISDSLSIGGGYDSISGKLEMKITVELKSSLTVADAIDGLSELIGDQIPLGQSFYANFVIPPNETSSVVSELPSNETDSSIVSSRLFYCRSFIKKSFGHKMGSCLHAPFICPSHLE